MKFKQKFSRDVDEGDYLEVTVEGRYWCRATIHRDDQDAWKDEDQYKAVNHRRDYKTVGQWLKACGKDAVAKAAFERDEWWWCGVVLEVRLHDPNEDPCWADAVQLVEPYDNALWGMEANYPNFDKRRQPNAHLTETANDLLSEAVAVAKTAEGYMVREKIMRAAGLPLTLEKAA